MLFSIELDFIFEQIPSGGDRNFSYLIGDRKHQVAAVVDPSFLAEKVLERANAQSLKIHYIINTHGHSDHFCGNKKVQEFTGARVAAFKDSNILKDIFLDHDSQLELGGILLKFFHVPGHKDDHIVVWLPAYGIAITGDLLFVGKVGGTSTEEDAKKEWDSLQFLLSKFPDETTIWPGHDYGCRPSSTIRLERLCNPFLRCKDVEEFIRLKLEWSDFKVRYGLR
jgi:glyoxylase-like metal-dependent hydrolase (beta-lactamase superfamily II)